MSTVNDDEFESLDYADEDADHLCDDCGHFHSGGECPDPNEPCGDYRCCIN